ncbi:MAG: ATPase [Deltaproteobacteria bacterium]|nr:ATPase [Deltaproteobacteria bacterium]
MKMEWMRKLLPAAQMPQILLLLGFAGVIFAGALLLLIPACQRDGRVGFVDALFTATSAVCVTGLIVVDTPTAYTVTGQTVILALIQVGGLGIMTFAALAFLVLGRRLSLASQAALHDSFFQRDLGIQFKKRFFQILATTAVIEALGALLLFEALLARRQNPLEALFASIFHSVSAFCNAGFSTFSDNLIGLRDSPLAMGVVMALIVLGGLGHSVNQELWNRIRDRVLAGTQSATSSRFSVHCRTVLTVTAILIFGGAVAILFMGQTPSEASPGIKLSCALFQSVTSRTAGFNTVDIGRLPMSTLMFIALLMFIGGSPGSCAGGIKTTAAAISLAELRARLLGEEEVRLFDRRIPKETLWRTISLIRLALLWNLIGILLLSITEGGLPGVGLHDIVFEQISAFGTVGLSTGLTFRLSTPGKLWIIATMFIGRLGPLTIAVWMFPGKHVHVRYPEARIMIG